MMTNTKTESEMKFELQKSIGIVRGAAKVALDPNYGWEVRGTADIAGQEVRCRLGTHIDGRPTLNFQTILVGGKKISGVIISDPALAKGFKTLSEQAEAEEKQAEAEYVRALAEGTAKVVVSLETNSEGGRYSYISPAPTRRLAYCTLSRLLEEVYPGIGNKKFYEEVGEGEFEIRGLFLLGGPISEAFAKRSPAAREARVRASWQKDHTEIVQGKPFSASQFAQLQKLNAIRYHGREECEEFDCFCGERGWKLKVDSETRPLLEKWGFGTGLGEE